MHDFAFLSNEKKFASLVYLQAKTEKKCFFDHSLKQELKIQFDFFFKSANILCLT